MKILAINGSPSGTGGSTWWVLEKFLKGAAEAGAETEVVQLAGKKIHHCTGELACWFKTPGRCVFSDDMDGVMAAMKAADALVLATPVYVDGMTGLMKNCIDRMVPVADPHFEMRDGRCRHPRRVGTGIGRMALVSTCGFFELENFDPLVAHVKAICANLGVDFAGSVLRPAAPMFPSLPTIHPLFFRIRSVAKGIERAGREFASDSRISDEAARAASADIISKEKYFEEANGWFDKKLAGIRT